MKKLFQWFAELFGRTTPKTKSSSSKSEPEEQLLPPLPPIADPHQEVEQICRQITQSTEAIIGFMQDDRQKTKQLLADYQQLVSKLDCLLRE